MFIRIVLILAVGIMIGNALGIGGGKDSHTTSATSATAPPAREVGEMRSTDYAAGDWPLTVGKGTVRCDDGGNGTGAVVFQTSDGTDYAVNGLALMHYPGMPKINQIWKRPGAYGLRPSVGPIIDAGLKLC